MTRSPDIAAITDYFKELQQDICKNLSRFEPNLPFNIDQWQHSTGGAGNSRTIADGEVFEKGGINFSHVKGDRLPPSASAGRPEIAGLPFEATGVSVVIHPRSPYIPTCHMNIRFFCAGTTPENAIWWFGGGYDLTPYYGFVEDCVHWHKIAKMACEQFSPDYYPTFKKQCDDYFFLKHRNEARGIGGIFFDDFAEYGFDKSFDFVKTIGNSFISAYLPIIKKRKDMSWTQSNRDFQSYRRGRYVEFNLIYDRGTLFGLQSGGRTESILMSLPPIVRWGYQWAPVPDSAEARLTDYFLVARDWAALTAPNTY